MTVARKTATGCLDRSGTAAIEFALFAPVMLVEVAKRQQAALKGMAAERAALKRERDGAGGQSEGAGLEPADGGTLGGDGRPGGRGDGGRAGGRDGAAAAGPMVGCGGHGGAGAPGAYAVLTIGAAGWHQSGDKLRVPENITLLYLPPYSPALSPVENVWGYLRGNKLSNRVFDTYDIIVDVCCNA